MSLRLTFAEIKMWIIHILGSQYNEKTIVGLIKCSLSVFKSQKSYKIQNVWIKINQTPKVAIQNESEGKEENFLRSIV